MGYISDIRCPKLVPLDTLSKDPYGFFKQNLIEMSDYAVGYLGSGKSMFDGRLDLALGKNYWIDSGIPCDEDTSEAACVGKTRKTYIRNIPTGTLPGINKSFVQITGSNIAGMTEMRGIIGGMIEDTADINPLTLGEGAMAMGVYGSNKCKKINLPVGSKIYDPGQEGKSWSWEKQCTASYLNSVPTTDPVLNEKLVSKNENIKLANRINGLGMGIPAGLGFAAENFTSYQYDNKLSIFFTYFSLFIIIIIALANCIENKNFIFYLLTIFCIITIILMKRNT